MACEADFEGWAKHQKRIGRFQRRFYEKGKGFTKQYLKKLGLFLLYWVLAANREQCGGQSEAQFRNEPRRKDGTNPVSTLCQPRRGDSGPRVLPQHPGTGRWA